MQKYKIKLMPGDHLSSYGITLAQYEEIGNRFIDDGCPRNEFPMSENAGGFRDEDFFGWSAHWGGFYHACESAFSGRLLSYDQVMEKETGADWFELGELPPAGIPIEVLPHNELWGFSSTKPQKCEVLAFHGYNFWCFNIDSQAYVSSRIDKVDFRPIESDRDNAIAAAVDMMPFGGATVEFFGKLYDAGLLRLPEKK